jgi:FtsP/CotA-like multicopper oxidase with cupredoxin domain
MNTFDLQEGRPDVTLLPSTSGTPATVWRLCALAFCLSLLAQGTQAQTQNFVPGGNNAIPTGSRPSPRFNAQPFSQKLLLFEEFGTDPMPTTYTQQPSLPCPPNAQSCPDSANLDNFLKQPLWPRPERLCNEAPINPWCTEIENCLGRTLDTPPADARPPGEGWAHQRWDEFAPSEYFQSAQTGARTNNGMRDAKQRHHYSVGEFGPGGLYHNPAGIANGTTAGIPIRIHPNMPVQDPRAVWTFDGTLPPKLLMARYGKPVLFRHYNALPIDSAANMGFGFHTITTHEHNGHNPAESDGYTHAYSFPGQHFDYRWPMILAGHDTVNTSALDARAGTPDGNGGITKVRGDYRETMSTHWFHDHMLDYTAQNVYKGNAAMMNYYSALDRGNEAVNDGVNLRFPSGTALDWGNRDYDVNLVVADKAWGQNGQLWFNQFNTDGFLGDCMTVNWQFAPYMDVRARRYRFRILNGSVSRYVKLAVVNQNGQPVPFHMIANDGNIMEHAVAFDGTGGTTAGILPVQGIAERFDIVVDFKNFWPGERLYLVNVLQHTDGAAPDSEIPLPQVFYGGYNPITVDDDGDGIQDRWINGDPCVTKIMEFRVQSYSGTDLSMNPADFVEGKAKMIPLPRASGNELAQARHHTFEFAKSGGTDAHPWTIRTDGGQGYTMDPRRVSAAPNLGELSADGMGHLEIWKLKSGGGWAHPVHIHFEEGIILSRDGQPPPVWEKWARKDVYHIGGGPGSSGEMEVALRFREFAGTYVEHCHNTQHEDTAMLLRWDLEKPGQVALMPAPVPTWDGVTTVPSFSLPLARIGDGFGPNGQNGPGGNNQGQGNNNNNLGLTTTHAQFSATQGWRLRGRLANATGTEHISAYVGPTTSGPLVGTTSVSANGHWMIRVSPGPNPNPSQMVSFQASNGATMTAVPVQMLP